MLPRAAAGSTTAPRPQWHADRAARRPKPARLAVNMTLRTYVQDRLAGLVVAPDGAAVSGPVVPWKGRRHGVLDLCLHLQACEGYLRAFSHGKHVHSSLQAACAGDMPA